MKQQEKKDLTSRIARLKKDIVQTQKTVKNYGNQNKQLMDDIEKLSSVICNKGGKNQQSLKEVCNLRRECK
jgi:hypothetical protein